MDLLLAQATGTTALWTFAIYIGAVFLLAWFANRLLRERSFLSEYFLGSRSLGTWAFAFTFAATSASGGSFTGFPSKIYVHGWILGLWIASYLIYPICTMGFLGKRLNQVARISGAITIPDVLRDRFRSAGLGLLAVTLIVFFMSFNLVAQFKSGSEILRTLLRDVPLFQAAAGGLAAWKPDWTFLADVNSDYLLCLSMFALSVVVYTTYGGFHAVVWTDVMQGIVMVIGVLILFPLMLNAVGGMRKAHQSLSEMTPPRVCQLEFHWPARIARGFSAPAPWIVFPGDDADHPRLVRVGRDMNFSVDTQRLSYVGGVQLNTPSEITRQLARLRESIEARRSVAEDPAAIASLADTLQTVWQSGKAAIMSPELVTTLAGDESAEGVEVAITWSAPYRYGADQPGTYTRGPGPVPASLPENPGTIELRGLAADVVVDCIDERGYLALRYQASHQDVRLSLAEGTYQLQWQSNDLVRSIEVAVKADEDVQVDAATAVLAETPTAARPQGPHSGFLPLGLVFSFFFMWAISGTGQPGYMVRLMAFRDTKTLRRAIFTVAIYYSLIYFPLVIIFVASRILLPGMELESDRIMPQLAITLTSGIGHVWLAGILIAAPFAAVMSTVDSFLLVISSGLVRDVYQRNINPQVSERVIKRLSYACTLVVGSGAMLGAVNPPAFLQDIIVYTGSGLAACFLAPVAYALYWPRSNSQGCIAGMLAGFLAHLSMYLAGWSIKGSFYDPWRLGGMDPIIVGLVVSFTTVPIVTRLTAAPPADLVRKFFCRPGKTV